jgi:hypothetical protein
MDIDALERRLRIALRNGGSGPRVDRGRRNH